jgi:hypothetical protein
MLRQHVTSGQVLIKRFAASSGSAHDGVETVIRKRQNAQLSKMTAALVRRGHHQYDDPATNIIATFILHNIITVPGWQVHFMHALVRQFICCTLQTKLRAKRIKTSSPQTYVGTGCKMCPA